MCENERDEHGTGTNELAWTPGLIEYVKARTATFNSLATGCWIGGFVLPYLAVISHLFSFPASLDRMRAARHVDEAAIYAIIGGFFSVGVGWWFGNMLHRQAIETILSLDDPHPTLEPEVRKILARKTRAAHRASPGGS